MLLSDRHRFRRTFQVSPISPMCNVFSLFTRLSWERLRRETNEFTRDATDLLLTVFSRRKLLRNRAHLLAGLAQDPRFLQRMSKVDLFVTLLQAVQFSIFQVEIDLQRSEIEKLSVIEEVVLNRCVRRQILEQLRREQRDLQEPTPVKFFTLVVKLVEQIPNEPYNLLAKHDSQFSAHVEALLRQLDRETLHRQRQVGDSRQLSSGTESDEIFTQFCNRESPQAEPGDEDYNSALGQLGSQKAPQSAEPKTSSRRLTYSHSSQKRRAISHLLASDLTPSD